MTIARIRAVVLPLALVLALAGFVGFLTPFAIVTGSIALPSTFEWPVGLASGVVTMADGLHVVPVVAAGRVQVYDSRWEFVRGWQVNASGGTFAVRDSGDGSVVVLIERGDLREVHKVTGELISSGPLDRETLGPLQGGDESRALMTKPYLFPLWHPFIAWLCAAIGGALIAAVTFGVSLLPEGALTKFGLSDEHPDGVSPPAYTLVASYVIGTLIAAFMIFVFPGVIPKVMIGGIVLVNVIQLRRLIWGFEIQGQSVRVWFPLSPSMDVVLQPGELAAAEMPPVFGGQLTIRLASGKRLVLSAMGTTRFRLLKEHIQTVRATA